MLLIFFTLLGAVAQSQKSVTVAVDNKVTFTYKNDKAQKVELMGDFSATETGLFKKSKKRQMEKQSCGTWTYTFSSLPSDLYMYAFKVDYTDSLQLDPSNSFTLRNVDTYYSAFVLTGGVGDFFITQQVAHGTVQKVWYPSTVNGMKQRRLSVYLPPQYQSEASRRFPVLYLLHGSGGDESAWLECGCLAQIMDNLIAQRRCEPMIVVMPNGNAELDATPGESPYIQAKPSANNMTSMLGKIEEAFPREVIPFIDQHYRTIAQKQQRAIAGLSMGGLQTIFIAANNPSLFDYVGLFSAQTTNLMGGFAGGALNKVAGVMNKINNFFGANTKSDFDHVALYKDINEKLTAQFATSPRLYYIAVGKQDFVKKLNDNFREKLDELHLPYVYNETDGTHSWSNWRKYLIDFAPRLFK